MPRKLELVPHLSEAELKKRYRKAKDTVEARRWHLLWKVAVGWTAKQSAAWVGLNYDYARQIIRKYNEAGVDSVQNYRNKNFKKHGGGSRPLINEEQLKRLTEACQQKPIDGGVWTGPKVARWIEKETGKSQVHNLIGWDYLKKLGYSWQRPRPKHRSCCCQAQAEFKENLPRKVKELQERYPDAEIEVLFFDEHRVGLKPILVKVWSPLHQRPTAIVHHRYEWLYVYGFVNPKTGETYWYLIPRVNVQWLNLVFETLAQEAGVSDKKMILLVQDRAGWHMSNKVCLPSGIIVEHLPPYSPELQPAERLWKLVDEPLANTYVETIDELETILVKRCRFLQQNMLLEIRNLTNYHWLNYS